MKKAKKAELKMTSRHLARPKAGATVGSDDERLLRLERKGLIRRGTGGLPEWLGRREPPKLRGSVLQDLLRDRKAGW